MENTRNLTDGDYIARGVIILGFLVVLAIYMYTHPAPWSPLGQYNHQQEQQQEQIVPPSDSRGV